MKSPAELRVVLRRQWEDAARRESGLLGGPEAWPIVLPIGKPLPQKLRLDLELVKRHVHAWRGVTIGKVLWEKIRYRQTAEPVDIPVSWQLSKPTEWIDAIGDKSVYQEFRKLTDLVKSTPSIFHSAFVRRRSLWTSKRVEEVIQAANLAMSLAPGCAEGRPLRMLAWEGIDTKFFERHAALVTVLLDLRYENEVSKIGLEAFLGAYQEGDHWVLVVDLDGNLLPFQKIRVRCSELRQTPLPGDLLLIVENESCQHLLPRVSSTLAVLGTGFDLYWTEAEWLSSRKVAYWGDMDTWGLQFLAKVRLAIPHLTPLMMNEEAYDTFSRSAVAEPVVAGETVPSGLDNAEAMLYRRLLSADQGRLEQEFLAADYVKRSILAWASYSGF